MIKCYSDPNTGDHEVPVQWPHFDPDLNERLVVSDDYHLEPVPENQANLYHFWMEEFPQHMEKKPPPITLADTLGKSITCSTDLCKHTFHPPAKDNIPGCQSLNNRVGIVSDILK